LPGFDPAIHSIEANVEASAELMLGSATGHVAEGVLTHASDCMAQVPVVLLLPCTANP
jgi:hypothetical protein